MNWISYEKIRELLLIGSDAMARVNYITQEMRVIESSKTFKQEKFSDYLLEVISSEERRINLGTEEPLRIELDHFIKSVEHDTEPIVSGEDGIQAVKIANIAMKSVETGKVLKI